MNDGEGVSGRVLVTIIYGGLTRSIISSPLREALRRDASSTLMVTGVEWKVGGRERRGQEREEENVLFLTHFKRFSLMHF